MFSELNCPHCHSAQDDPFEVLDVDRVEAMGCEACGQRFFFAIMECHRCANDDAVSWLDEPPPSVLDELTCGKCGATYRYRASEDHPCGAD